MDNILSLYTQFNLDGIDIDWEYPGAPGYKGNQVASDDTSNLLSFFQMLRATLPPSAKITAAVQHQPFVDSYGNPLEDASEFAKVLDWVVIMNYDTWGCEYSFLFRGLPTMSLSTFLFFIFLSHCSISQTGSERPVI